MPDRAKTTDRDPVTGYTADETAILEAIERTSVEYVRACAAVWHWGDGAGGHAIDRIYRVAATMGLDLPPTQRKFPSLAQALADRDGWTCHYCGHPLGYGHESVRSPEADHLLPKALGGDDGIANRVLSCGPCNRRKHATPHDDYWHDCPGLPL